MNWKKLIVPVIILGILVLLYFDATREFIKYTVFFVMPGLVVWGYWRRFKPYTLPWIALLLVMAGLLVGWVLMMKQLPEKIASRAIVRQGDVYMVERKYDKAIEKYRELHKYGLDSKMKRKIKEAMAQKEFDRRYQKARELAAAGRKEEALKLLRAIPRGAVVYKKAQELIGDIEEK